MPIPVEEASSEAAMTAPRALMRRWLARRADAALASEVRGVRFVLRLVDPPWRRASEAVCDFAQRHITASTRSRLITSWPAIEPT